MGSSSSAVELGAKLQRAGTAVAQGGRGGVEKSALFAKGAMLGGAASAGLRDGALVGRDRARPAKHGVGFNVVGKTNVTALVKYRVPRIATIFNSGARPHVISRRRDPFGVLKFGPGRRDFAMGPVRHPGVAGRNFWPAVKAKVYGTSRQNVVTGVTSGLKKIFR